MKYWDISLIKSKDGNRTSLLLLFRPECEEKRCTYLMSAGFEAAGFISASFTQGQRSQVLFFKPWRRQSDPDAGSCWWCCSAALNPDIICSDVHLPNPTCLSSPPTSSFNMVAGSKPPRRTDFPSRHHFILCFFSKINCGKTKMVKKNEINQAPEHWEFVKLHISSQATAPTGTTWYYKRTGLC